MSITLSKAQSSDLGFLLDLRKQSMHAYLVEAGITLTDAQHLDRVKFEFAHAHLVKYEHEPVGLLKFQEQDSQVDILQLQILPTFQGKGIGSFLIEYVFDIARKLSKSVTLKVLKNNPAKRLYERYGFVMVGEDAHEFFMRRVIV